MVALICFFFLAEIVEKKHFKTKFHLYIGHSRQIGFLALGKRGNKMNNILISPRNHCKYARKTDFIVCKQQSHRQAYAYTHTDQRLCYLLSVKYYEFTTYMQNFDILASLCS